MIPDLRGAAFVSEGFCPLCDELLQSEEITDGLGSRTLDVTEPYCPPCDVAWKIIIDERGHPIGISASRRLTPAEIRRLYARPEEGDS